MEHSPVLRPGDLVFVRGHLYNPVDDAIKLGEWLQHQDRPLWGCYSHVALSLGGNGLVEAQGCRTSGYALLDEYAGNYDIGRIDWTDEQREAIKREANSPDNLNLPYDWLMIGDVAWDALTKIDIPYHERVRRICSTFTRMIIKNATGVEIPPNPHCTPEDQALDPHVRLEVVK